MNRLKNSEATRSAKSFGESIKKHIFHKSIISRTPKRTSTATPIGIETPNFSNNKQPKLRVLFQSPTPSSCAVTDTVTPELLPGKTSTLPVTAVTNTAYALKTHPLTKSISSSSLILNSSQRNPHSHHSHQSSNKLQNDESDSLSSCSSSTHSNDSLPQSQPIKLGCSVSAPVSRQTSRDLQTSNTLPHKMCILNESNSSSLSSSSTASSQNFQLLEANCCVTPLKLISAAKQLIAGGGGIIDKKSVAWDDHQLLDIDELTVPYTSLQACSNVNELKSRYKSEPNLSRIVKDKLLDIPETVPEQQNTPVFKINTCGTTGKSLTRKLIKGVSMGNLKFPFSTPESTKRIVRSVSSSLKRRHSDDSQRTSQRDIMPVASTSTQFVKLPLLEHDYNNMEDLDDETFEDDPNDHVGSDSEIDDDNHDEADETLESTLDVQTGVNSNSCDIPDVASGVCNSILVQPSGLYRNIDLITSTPSLLLGRRSMSPITKSAQRMPRSMQESIMTPRSRKPVMVLTTALGSSDPNQTIYQTDLSSFREQDEDNSSCTDTPNLHNEDALSVGSYTEIMNTKLKDRQESEEIENEENSENNKTDVLSQDFKKYLKSRSVLTENSPVDSSFSSHPDDFGDDDSDKDSTDGIANLNESQLSPSLLYCLDGNEPEEKDIDLIINVNDDPETHSNYLESPNDIYSTPPTHISQARGHLSRREAFNPLCSQNNARKRAATNDITKLVLSPTKSNQNIPNELTSVPQSSEANKENQELIDNYLLSKKILISDFPNETSF